MTYNKEKPNSLEIMEQFYKAQADIKAMNSELVRVRNKMNTKLAILNSINAYTASLENIMLSKRSQPQATCYINSQNRQTIN